LSPGAATDLSPASRRYYVTALPLLSHRTATSAYSRRTGAIEDSPARWEPVDEVETSKRIQRAHLVLSDDGVAPLTIFLTANSTLLLLIVY
jgi:hypothetical protein